MRHSLTILAAGIILLAACKKEDDAPTPTPSPSPTPQGLVDVDGNVYDTVVIGGRTWMADNLGVTKYRNGDAIVTSLNFFDWQAATIGAYSVYDDATTNNTTYGKLYNWFAMNDIRGLCPTGWSVPSDQDWMDLEAAVGVLAAELTVTGERGIAINAGGKLKATQLWTIPNLGATNSSGFAALPGGSRISLSAPPLSYSWLGVQSTFWTRTTFNSTQAYRRRLMNSSQGILRENNALKSDGYSCRCVKDL